MNLDEVKRQFVEQVKLRAYDDKYIDKNEEREILQIALQQGVTVDSARSALSQVCEGNGYILESRVMQQVKELMETFSENDGKIDEKEFNDAVATCRKATQNKKSEAQCKRMVLEVIQENSFKTTTGWFGGGWFAKVKKEVGLA